MLRRDKQVSRAIADFFSGSPSAGPGSRSLADAFRDVYNLYDRTRVGERAPSRQHRVGSLGATGTGCGPGLLLRRGGERGMKREHTGREVSGIGQRRLVGHGLRWAARQRTQGDGGGMSRDVVFVSSRGRLRAAEPDRFSSRFGDRRHQRLYRGARGATRFNPGWDRLSRAGVALIDPAWCVGSNPPVSRFLRASSADGVLVEWREPRGGRLARG